MDDLQKDISKRALQIQTFSRPKLTKGQTYLLKEIRNCTEKQTSLNWDIIVNCFYNNVSKECKDWKWANATAGDYSREWYKYDILECYEQQNSKWQYTIKPRIRQWFVSTIGILVIKNQLIIIPTIEMD